MSTATAPGQDPWSTTKKEDRVAKKYVRYATPEEALAARLSEDNGCLVWSGAATAHGYGIIRVDGKLHRVHRYVWEKANGAIPNGMVIDHTCWNPRCANLLHLRLATMAQNQASRQGAGVNNKRTGIRNVYPDGSGYAVRVKKNGMVYGHTHRTIEAAREEAESLRRELFGDFAGRG